MITLSILPVQFSEELKFFLLLVRTLRTLIKFLDFKDAMLKLKDEGVNFEINITLTEEN